MVLGCSVANEWGGALRSALYVQGPERRRNMPLLLGLIYVVLWVVFGDVAPWIFIAGFILCLGLFFIAFIAGRLVVERMPSSSSSQTYKHGTSRDPDWGVSGSSLPGRAIDQSGCVYKRDERGGYSPVYSGGSEMPSQMGCRRTDGSACIARDSDGMRRGIWSGSSPITSSGGERLYHMDDRC